MSSFPWFRWYSGSVTDPKFQLVAKRAGTSLPDVLAVWAYLLEAASQAEDRGCFGKVDSEALDVLFGFPEPDTLASRILSEFEARGLTQSGRISAWEKRQVKREREDKTGAERQRAHRTKQGQVTPRNASPDQKKPRGEEIRGDKKNTPPTPLKGEPGGFPEFYAAYPRKEGRARAAKAFASVDVPLQTLLHALAAHKRTEQWLKDGGRFVPLPASWLTGRRWEDQLQPAAGAAGYDPDSRLAVEAEGQALGIGKWNENVEQWHQYKARVRSNATPSQSTVGAVEISQALAEGLERLNMRGAR